MADDETSTAAETHAWATACDAYDKLVAQFRSAGVPPNDLLVIAGFIVAGLQRNGDVDSLVEIVRAIARRILDEHMKLLVEEHADAIITRMTEKLS